MNDFLSALAVRNTDAALKNFHKAIGGGGDPKTFTLLVITKVRGVLLLRFAPSLEKDLAEQFGPDDIVFLKKLAGTAGAAINATMLSELLTALIEMNRAPLPSIPLELALYRALSAKE